jgi:hypothetical protein
MTDVWTGSEWFILAGEVSSSTPQNEIAKYDPATDTWTKLPPWPASVGDRTNTEVVFTGTEVIFWGGDGSGGTVQTGARYDVTNGVWSTIPTGTLNLPMARRGHALVYDQTANSLIVWGGTNVQGIVLGHGAILNLTTGTWLTMPAAPISNRTGFVYEWDPVKRWLYVFGSSTELIKANQGAIYDAALNTWQALPAVPTNFPPRLNPGSGLAAGKFVVWGGSDFPDYYNTGLIYDPATNTWTHTANANAFIAGRTAMASAYNGDYIMFWGGHLPIKADGAFLDVKHNVWLKMNTSSLGARAGAAAAWTPFGILIWGGANTTTKLSDGAIYFP